MSKTIKVSKLEVARLQLLQAIKLYFQSGDEVSLHTLAAAAVNVLNDLCEHKGLAHGLSQKQLLEMIKPEQRDDVRRAMRAPENFFKHADKDPDAMLEFNSQASEFWLMEGVESYLLLTGERELDFGIYKAWWMIQYQALLENAPTEVKEAAAGLKKGFPREDRAKFYERTKAMGDFGLLKK